MSARDTHRTLTHLIRACDVVFGSTSILLAGFATWAWTAGLTNLGLVLALWSIPVCNISWSLITKHHDRVRADFVRGIVCAPVGTYIYASGTGVLSHHWVTSLMLSVAVCLSVGIGTRRLTGSLVIAALYSLGIVAVADSFAIRDGLGLMLTDTILSIVAVYLGRTLVDATQQRDDASDQRARAEASVVQLNERGEALSRAVDELQQEIARRIRAETELLHAQKLESVGRLAAGIAHEINTPLQFINDSVYFTREAVGDLLVLAQRAPGADTEELDYLTAEVPDALARAQDGLTRVTTIVRSMKMFAHPDGNDLAAADLNRAIEATLVISRNEYRFVADLVTDLDPELPMVMCFISELNQAVLNMVVNAAHAIADAGHTSDRRGTIEVQTRRDGDHVVISIRDTGTGIPDSVRGRIFDPFFTTKEVGRGTGQGLAITHAVVERHRGKLWFETEMGRGTCFFIKIPIDGDALAVAS